jgi:hypothetical protein
MDEPVGIFEKNDYADCFTRAGIYIIRVLLKPQLYYFVNNK